MSYCWTLEKVNYMYLHSSLKTNLTSSFTKLYSKNDAHGWSWRVGVCANNGRRQKNKSESWIYKPYECGSDMISMIWYHWTIGFAIADEKNHTMQISHGANTNGKRAEQNILRRNIFELQCCALFWQIFQLDSECFFTFAACVR